MIIALSIWPWEGSVEMPLYNEKMIVKTKIA